MEPWKITVKMCIRDRCGDEEMSRMEEAMAVYGDVFAKYCTYHAKPYDGIKEMLELSLIHILNNKA